MFSRLFEKLPQIFYMTGKKHTLVSSMFFINPISGQYKLQYQGIIHVSPYLLKWLSSVQLCFHVVSDIIPSHECGIEDIGKQGESV